ncbi:MAG: ABC transporter ATP-binding protein [Desulfobacteraceae bacterium]|nr:ABC transporter ATP-binding protein [Desulfobacteraceae bacterium]
MLLSLRGVEAGYGPVAALRGVDLTVGQGEIVTLIGANGAGKSTLLLAISGLVAARRGEIVLAGQRIDGLPPHRIVGLGISQVPEGRRIFPQLTVRENLELGAFLRRDRQGVRADLDYVFSFFPILAERRRQDGGTLSGGEQQMLAIARAIMARPRLLLLDEPSLGLAPIVIRQIFSVVRQINQEQGVSVLLVEQNANLALKTASRGYVLENGEMVLSGSAGELLHNDQVRLAYLGG